MPHTLQDDMQADFAAQLASGDFAAEFVYRPLGDDGQARVVAVVSSPSERVRQEQGERWIVEALHLRVAKDPGLTSGGVTVGGVEAPVFGDRFSRLTDRADDPPFTVQEIVSSNFHSWLLRVERQRLSRVGQVGARR